jgi:hypothetical protein
MFYGACAGLSAVHAGNGAAAFENSILGVQEFLILGAPPM